MENFLFFTTNTTTRGGLYVGFQTWDKQHIIERINNNENYDTIRYGQLNCGFSENIKLMSLDEFEQIFKYEIINNTFSHKTITKIFRKEISLKYGVDSKMKKLDRIPKKDLIVGGVYLADNNSKYVYFGKVKGYTYTPKIKRYYGDYDQEKTENFEGYLLSNFYKKQKTFKEHFNFYNPGVTKNIRKLIKKLDESYDDIPKEYTNFKDYMNNSKYKFHIEFLDVEKER